MNLGITGHRPARLPPGSEHTLYTALEDAITTINDESSIDRVISGMSLGTDQVATEVALALGIPVTAIVPHSIAFQSMNWSQKAKAHYLDLLRTITSSPHGRVLEVFQQEFDEGTASPHDIYRWRNEAIVEDSDHLLAVWDGAPHGGIYNTLCFALERCVHNDLTLPLDPQPLYDGDYTNLTVIDPSLLTE